jgi:hypothetical protein
MRKRLTAAFVKTEEKKGEYWDDLLPGFMLRIQGGKSWCVWYRLNGQHRRLTIGKVTTFKIEKARKIATDVLAR